MRFVSYSHQLQPELGRRIRLRRLQLRMTQRDLAGNEFSCSYICQVEKGRLLPSLPAASLLAQRLAVSLDDLLAPQVLQEGELQECGCSPGARPGRNGQK